MPGDGNRSYCGYHCSLSGQTNIDKFLEKLPREEVYEMLGYMLEILEETEYGIEGNDGETQVFTIL